MNRQGAASARSLATRLLQTWLIAPKAQFTGRIERLSVACVLSTDPTPWPDVSSIPSCAARSTVPLRVEDIHAVLGVFDDFAGLMRNHGDWVQRYVETRILGWRDGNARRRMAHYGAINFVFVNDPNQHVSELQLQHTQMHLVRTAGNAHEACARRRVRTTAAPRLP